MCLNNNVEVGRESEEKANRARERGALQLALGSNKPTVTVYQADIKLKFLPCPLGRSILM